MRRSARSRNRRRCHQRLAMRSPRSAGRARRILSARRRALNGVRNPGKILRRRIPGSRQQLVRIRSVITDNGLRCCAGTIMRRHAGRKDAARPCARRIEVTDMNGRGLSNPPNSKMRRAGRRRQLPRLVGRLGIAPDGLRAKRPCLRLGGPENAASARSAGRYAHMPMVSRSPARPRPDPHKILGPRHVAVFGCRCAEEFDLSRYPYGTKKPYMVVILRICCWR
jgi:hypothetical protein